MRNSLTVFFDIGGTLLSSPDLFETITANLTNQQPDKKTRDLVLDIFMKLFQNQEGYQSIEEMIAVTLAFMAREYGYPDISNRAHDIHDEVFLHKSNLFPETRYVLDKLHTNSIRMIVASDADARLVDEQIVKHRLKKYFADICTSDLVQAYKPSSKYVDYLKKYAFENKESCYFVGDNVQDIESGKRLGIKSVLIDRKNSKGKTDADYVIHDLNELLPILGLK